MAQWDNGAVKHDETDRHPGPMRFMTVGGEGAAIIVAISFVVLGLVSVPLAKFFLLGAILLGIGVAILFRFIRRKPLFPTRFFRN